MLNIVFYLVNSHAENKVLREKLVRSSTCSLRQKKGSPKNNWFHRANHFAMSAVPGGFQFATDAAQLETKRFGQCLTPTHHRGKGSSLRYVTSLGKLGSRYSWSMVILWFRNEPDRSVFSEWEHLVACTTKEMGQLSRIARNCLHITTDQLSHDLPLSFLLWANAALSLAPALKF